MKRRANPAADLLRWYRRQARPLPWRKNQNPWRVWVSEIMLQQTRVAVVEPRFEAFLNRFPTVTDLAEATQDEVLAAWSGLGYYRRARSLHAAARRIVAAGGSFPRTAAAWRELPGIGSYTAAAIASIAFSEVVPVVDGNVERVVTRYRAVAGDPKRASIRRQIEGHAVRLLEPSAPGESNQALMELGATLCRPRQPLCTECPLQSTCEARLAESVEQYPNSRSRRRSVERAITCVVVEDHEGRCLLFRRSADEVLLAGSWELPWVGSVDVPILALADRYGGSWNLEGEVGEVRHAITFRRLRVTVRRGRVETSPKLAGDFAWLSAAERAEVATSSLVDKVLALAATPLGGGSAEE